MGKDFTSHTSPSLFFPFLLTAPEFAFTRPSPFGGAHGRCAQCTDACRRGGGSVASPECNRMPVHRYGTATQPASGRKSTKSEIPLPSSGVAISTVLVGRMKQQDHISCGERTHQANRFFSQRSGMSKGMIGDRLGKNVCCA